MKRFIVSIFIFIMIFAANYDVQAIDNQNVLGAGPSTKVAQAFFLEYSNEPEAKGYSFNVMPKSVKHAGGINATNNYIFGRTGRPLNQKEKDMNKAEILLARVPIVFVVGTGPGISELSIEQLKAIYTGRITNWKDVGGPDKAIVLAGREPSEALFSILKKEYPFLQSVSFSYVFKKDHQVVKFLKTTKGEFAIGFGAKPNFKDKYIISVPGFSSGVNLGLVYDLKNAKHPLVKGAEEFAKSDKWIKKLTKQDLLPPR